MKLKLYLGLFLILTLPAFFAGALLTKWLMTEHPSPVPVILSDPELPPPVDYDYPIPLFAVKSLMHWADVTHTPIWVMAKTGHWESGDNPNYHSRRNDNGSYDDGYMGLNSYSLPWFSTKYNEGKTINPYDVDQAVMVAAKWMRDLFKDKGDWRLVAGAWNAGPSTPEALWKPVTIRHVKAILGVSP